MHRVLGTQVTRSLRVVIAVLLGGISLLAAAQARVQRSPVAATTASQTWEYQHAWVCQTPEIDAASMPNLLLGRLQSLGSQGFELVSVINFPLTKDAKADFCIYVVFKRPR